mgnify:CR=1 FL=1
MSKSRSKLEVLFGSKARVKMLKFLFHNQGPGFTAREIAARIQELPATVNIEIKKFMEIGLLRVKK